MNQTYIDHEEAYEWEGSYAYLIVGQFLHLISLPISRREIHVYKVASTYTTNFLQCFRRS
jgi:hypothetical protein